MTYKKCPKCEGAGKIKTEKPIASDMTGLVEEGCDLCDGTGWLMEDATPLIVERLDIIITILKEIKTGGR